MNTKTLNIILILCVLALASATTTFADDESETGVERRGRHWVSAGRAGRGRSAPRRVGCQTIPRWCKHARYVRGNLVRVLRRVRVTVKGELRRRRRFVVFRAKRANTNVRPRRNGRNWKRIGRCRRGSLPKHPRRRNCPKRAGPAGPRRPRAPRVSCKGARRWNRTRAYAVGATVRFRMRLWRATSRNTNRRPRRNSRNWRLLGRCLRLSCLNSTVWNRANKYARGALVRNRRRSRVIFRARLANQGVRPGKESRKTWRRIGRCSRTRPICRMVVKWNKTATYNRGRLVRVLRRGRYTVHKSRLNNNRGHLPRRRNTRWWRRAGRCRRVRVAAVAVVAKRN